jgi:hypothetical protein
MVAQGSKSATATLAPGTYYISIDGPVVDNTGVTVAIT